MRAVEVVPGATVSIVLLMRCDNYATCRSKVPEQATRTATVMLALARGWHLWSGRTMGGRLAHVTLCRMCVGADRRPEHAPIDPLGQKTLF